MNRTLPIQALMSIVAVAAAVALPATADAAPDTTPPVLRGITLPATVAGSSVAVSSEASDDVAVSQLRLANEDGTWAPWQAYSPSVAWELSAGTGYKAVFVQVRDAAGNESPTILTRLTRVAAPTGTAGDANDPTPTTDDDDPADTTTPVGTATSTLGDETITVRNEHGTGAAMAVRTDDGGLAPAGRVGTEANLSGIDLPRRRRDQVVRLLNRLDDSGRTGRRLVRVLRRSNADIRVANLSAIGAWGTWSPASNELVLDIGLLREAHHVYRVSVLAHEAGHALWDRRDYDAVTYRHGGNRAVQYLLNEAVAGSIGDQVLGDLGYGKGDPNLWTKFRGLLRSSFYRQWYGLSRAELDRGRQQAPRVVRALTPDLVELGVERRFLLGELPG